MSFMYKILVTISTIRVCYALLIGSLMEVIPRSWKNSRLFYATGTLDLSDRESRTAEALT